MKRILPIDGLRAFSALGVVWIHCWSFCKNPSLNFLSFDIYKLVAIAGNGVDFFFAISGFCMYMMFQKKDDSSFSYKHFLIKRFLRIAPAFYASVLVYATIIKFSNPSFKLLYNVFFHFLFLNNIITGNTISGPFWSIGVEWHFYMILPIVGIFRNKMPLPKIIFTLSFLSILFFCFLNFEHLNVLWWENQIVIRFPEFGSGIIAAYLFVNNKKIPNYVKGNLGLLVGFLVMFIGRTMMYTPVLQKIGGIAFFFKSISYTVMTTGFSLIMLLAITYKSFFSILLSNKFIIYIGRISYSIYLWHSLSFFLLSGLLNRVLIYKYNVVIVLISVTALTILIAHFSYNIFESFYFKKRKQFIKPITLYAK